MGARGIGSGRDDRLGRGYGGGRGRSGGEEGREENRREVRPPSPRPERFDMGLVEEGCSIKNEAPIQTH